MVANEERGPRLTSPVQRLERLGLLLPEPATPAHHYLPAVVHERLVLVSGQLPKEDGEVRVRGKVGAHVDLEEARHAARICTLQGLACAAAAVGELNLIRRVLRVGGWVASAAGFHDQPRVIDASSELLTDVFGNDGRHSRAAVGVAELPRNAPVEIEFIFAT